MLATEVTMEHDEACLILIHGIMMKVFQETGTHMFMMASVSRHLIEMGFENTLGAAVLQGAFRETAKVDDAVEFLKMIIEDDPKLEKQ